MKYIIALLLISGNVFAQNGIDITSLKSPSSPAFSILGIEPSQVTRPKTLNDLEVSLMNNFLSEGKFAIPKDFALEFTPYWIFKHDRLTFTEYVTPGNSEQLIRNLSVSVATASRKDIYDSSKTVQELSFGLRTQLIPTTKIPDEVQVAIQLVTNDQMFTGIVTGICLNMAGNGSASASFGAVGGIAKKTTFVTSLRAEAASFLAGYHPSSGKNLTAAEQQVLLDQFMDFVDQNIVVDPASYDNTNTSITTASVNKMNTKAYRDNVKTAISDHLADMNKEPTGSMLEMAMAGSVDFLSTDLKKSQLGKFAGWLTYTYRSDEANFHQGEFLSSLRATYDNIDTLKKCNIDLGIRGIYQYHSKLTLSLEILGRYQLTFDKCMDANGKMFNCHNNKFDWRLFFNAEYKINKTFSLTYGLGRDFDGNYITNGNFLSLLGLNVGIGNAKVVGN